MESLDFLAVGIGLCIWLVIGAAAIGSLTEWEDGEEPLPMELALFAWPLALYLHWRRTRR